MYRELNMTTKNIQLITFTFLFSAMTCGSAFAENQVSDLQADIRKLEKQMEFLKKKQSELLHQKDTENTTSAIPIKPTKTLTVLKDFVDKNNINGGSTTKEQVKAYVKMLKGLDPDLTDDQITTLVEAYEDAILEKTTGKQTHDANQPKKPLSGLALSHTPSNNSTTNEEKLKDYVTITESKEKKEPKKPDSTTVLENEAISTVISLVIKKGDTLSDIARRTYGNASMYMPIYEANRDKLKSPDRVPEGITLRVPLLSTALNYKKPATVTIPKPAKVERKKKLPKKRIRHRSYNSMAELERLILEGKL